MLYSEIDFRGKYIFNERRRVEKERLIAASFNAWQALLAHTDKLPTWNKYLNNLGLSTERKLTKENLKREADQAMANAQRIINKANKKDGCR